MSAAMSATRAFRAFQPTVRMMRPLPIQRRAAHTASQKQAWYKKIPAELLPLGVVVAFAVSAATYSILRHLIVDKNIRLKRQNRAADNAAHEAHVEHALAVGATDKSEEETKTD